MARMQHQDLPGLTATYDYTYNDYYGDENMIQTLSQTPLDAQSHSRQSSGNSALSETSPVSATFSTRTHRSESSSSLASSPPSFESDAWMVTSKKSYPALPDVVEESQDRELTPQHETVKSCYTSAATSPKIGSRRGSGEFRPTSFFNAVPSKYVDSAYSAYPSGEYLFMGPQSNAPPAVKEVNKRIAASIPGILRAGLSRTSSLLHSTTRKRSSTVATPVEAKFDTPKILSRSSSFRRSTMSRSQDASFSSNDVHSSSTQIDTIVEDGDLMSSPMEIADSNATCYFDVVQDHVVLEDPIVRSTTPLLPPVMNDMKEQEPIQSPLISPSFAPVTTLILTPLNDDQSPQLSAQASTTSFGRSRAGTVLSSSSEVHLNDSPAMREINDKLGHSNFAIFPSPYIPETCDLTSVNTLRAYYSEAVAGWATILEDNNMQYGNGSQLCNLMQAKWALIDAEWKRCIEETTRRGHAQGQLPMQMTPLELVPALPKAPEHKASESNDCIEVKATNISDPKICIGVGIDEILGPMAQDAPQVQPKPSLMRRLTIKGTRVARSVSSNLSGYRSPNRSQSPH
jgi:hypothetical protein